MKDFGKVVLLPDVHFPFASTQHLKEAYSIIRAEQPDLVVQVGDVYDNYNFSQWDKSQDVIGPKAELKAARSQMLAMWRRIDGIAPRAHLVQLGGNHDWHRIQKKIAKAAPELRGLFDSDMLDLLALWEAPGVELVRDWQDGYYCTVKGAQWKFEHGYLSKLGAHIAKNLDWNIGCGHLHRGGVAMVTRESGCQYELNAGFLGDRNHLAFLYGPTKLKDWTEGLGLIDKYGPRFISLR